MTGIAPGAAREGVATVNPTAISMPICGSGPRMNCVVDGDTVWVHGTKIRIAGIDAPEVSEPKCAAEAQLGAKATNRLVELLNAGAFTVINDGGRDEDKYGRKLRVIERDGKSVGDTLIEEGLARRYDGGRKSWCG